MDTYVCHEGKELQKNACILRGLPVIHVCSSIPCCESSRCYLWSQLRADNPLKTKQYPLETMLYYSISEMDVNYHLLTEEKNKALPNSDTLKTSEASSCSQFCSFFLSIIVCFYYSLSICHTIRMFLIFGSQSIVYLMGGLQLWIFASPFYFYCLSWYHHPFCFTWKANTWARSEKRLVSLFLWLHIFPSVCHLKIWEVFLVSQMCSNIVFWVSCQMPHVQVQSVHLRGV